MDINLENSMILVTTCIFLQNHMYFIDFPSNPCACYIAPSLVDQEQSNTDVTSGG